MSGLPLHWLVFSFPTRMFFSRDFGAWFALGILGLAGLGCEKKDQLAERKFQVLVEENARLAQTVAALDPAAAPAKPAAAAFSPEAGTQLAAENERLRAIVTGHERAQALAANKTQREAVEKQVA